MKEKKLYHATVYLKAPVTVLYSLFYPQFRAENYKECKNSTLKSPDSDPGF